MKNRIFAVVMVLLLACLFLVSCDKPTQLSEPTNVSYDGTHITWNAVDKADSYTVQINDGEPYTVKSTVYPYDANGSTFTVTVTAVSGASKIVKSAQTTVNFKPLGSVGELRVDENGVISWDVVDKATGYIVRIDGVEKSSGSSATSYADIPVGRHSVQVRPVIDGDKTYYSSWSKATTLEILGAVAKDDITYADGYIKWKYVPGAQYYEVSVNGVPLDSKCQGTQLEYNPSNTAFEVSVKAIGNGSSTFNGKVSEAKKFVFLDAVTNLIVKDGVLTWDPVNGADGYKIKLNGVIYSKTLTECSFSEFSQNINTDVSIMPISNDNTYFSSWSPTKSIFLLPAPVIRWNDYGLDGDANSNIYWDGIANADGYEVKIILPDGTEEKVSFGVTQRSFQHAYLQTGTYTVQVKAKAPAGSSNVYDSGYSTAIKVIRLDAPKPAGNNYITSDPKYLSEGFTVTFEKVMGATQYNLYKDNVLNKTISGSNNQFVVKDLSNSKVIEEQNYNYSIQSVGSGAQIVNGQCVVTLSSLTENSHNFTIKILATPTAPTIDGFKYMYGTVNYASGYVIDVGGQSFSSGETFYDLSMIEAGVYNVSVCARGNGTNVLPSDYAAPISVHRLDAPTRVRIETAEASEGVLKFNEVAHATGYLIVFNNDGNPIPVDTISNMNQYITEQGTTIYLQSSANCFNEDKTVYYMTSKPGTTTNFIKLSAPTFGDVAFNKNQLVWNAPKNINTQSFTPTYEVYGAGNMVYTGEKNGTSMDVSFLEGGRSYEFQVKAIGDGTTYINSDKSVTISVRKLGTPSVERVSGGYKWNNIAGTVNYAVYVDGVLVKTIETGDERFYTPNFTELKYYTVEVVAVGDGGYTTLDSAPCTIKQEVKQLQTPDFKISYSADSYVEEGNINVTITKESPYANGYVYTVGGATYASSESTYSYRPNSVGTFEVRVYAKGGNFDEDGVYYLDSQSQGGNSRYAITLLASPNKDSVTCSYDGLLKWAAVSGTSKYEVEIYLNNSHVKTVTSFGASLGLGDNGIETQNGDSLTVVIRALGDGVNIISSKSVEQTVVISR